MGRKVTTKKILNRTATVFTILTGIIVVYVFVIQKQYRPTSSTPPNEPPVTDTITQPELPEEEEPETEVEPGIDIDESENEGVDQEPDNGEEPETEERYGQPETKEQDQVVFTTPASPNQDKCAQTLQILLTLLDKHNQNTEDLATKSDLINTWDGMTKCCTDEMLINEGLNQQDINDLALVRDKINTWRKR